MNHINHLNVSSVNDPTSPTPSYASGMNQVSSGPAALLYTLANQLISLYGELQALYAQISMTESKAQKSLIDSGAEAQRSAASEQGWAIGCESIGSGIGAVVSGTAAVATYKGTSEPMSQLGQHQTELDNLNSFNNLAKNPATDVNAVLGPNAPPSINPQMITDRANELKRPNANQSYTPGGDVGKNNNLSLQQKETLDKAAFAHLKVNESGELTNLQNQTREDLKTKTEAVSGCHSAIQNVSTKYQMYTQIVQGLATASTKAGESQHQANAGEDQAAQQVSQAVNQQSQSSTDAANQKLSQYYDNVAGVIQAARQGAKADPLAG